MSEEQYVKDILKQIQVVDPDAFDRFSSEYTICFSKGKGNWLFPMMFDFYVNKVKNDRVIALLKQLGLFMHKKCKEQEMYEITAIDKSLCIDDSFVEDYCIMIQNAQSEEPTFQDLNSPWKTRGISLALYGISSILLNSIIFEYKDTNHPYILADIAAAHIYSQKFTEGIHYLYRSIKHIVNFPNRFWNSEYGLVGAANTFRLLSLMCPKENLFLLTKLLKYQYIYLTKLACTANNELFQQNAYVNRAAMELDRTCRFIIPLTVNPDLLYISDMYYAHFCNDVATQTSVASGWNYFMKSISFYRNGSLWPNNTGGYAEIEDKTYQEIVAEKHLQAIEIAHDFFQEFQDENETLSSEDIEKLFKLIQYECRNNYESLRNRVLNYKSYK